MSTIDANSILTQLAEAEPEEDIGRESEEFFAVNIPALLEALANLPTLPEGIAQEDLAVYGLSNWLGKRELRIATKLETLEQEIERVRTKKHKATQAIELLEKEVDYLETQLKASQNDIDKLKLEESRFNDAILKEQQKADEALRDLEELEFVKKKLEESEYALSLEKGTVVRLEVQLKALREEVKIDPAELEKIQSEKRELHAENEKLKIQIREQLGINEELRNAANGVEINSQLEREKQTLMDQNNLLATQLQSYKDQLLSLEPNAPSQTSKITLRDDSENVQIKKLEAELEQLRAELKQRKDDKVDEQKSTEETLLRQISTLNNERSKLLDSMDELESKLEEEKEKYEKLKTEMTELSEKLQTFDRDAHSMREQHLVLETIIKQKNGECEKLTDQIKELHDHLSNLRHEHEQAESQAKKAETDLLQARNDLAQTQNKLSQLQKEHGGSEQRGGLEERVGLEELERIRKQLKMAENENERLEKTSAAEIEYLRSTNKQLNSKIAQLENDDESTKDAEIKSRLNDQAEKIESLEIQLTQLKRQKSQLRHEKEDLVQRLEQQPKPSPSTPKRSPPHMTLTHVSPQHVSPQHVSPPPVVSRPPIKILQTGLGSMSGSEYLRSVQLSAEEVMKSLGRDEIPDGWSDWHVGVWTKQLSSLSPQSILNRTHTLGWTPLHLAVAVNDINVVTKLVGLIEEFNFSPTCPLTQLILSRDFWGRSVFDLANILHSEDRPQKVTSMVLLKLLSNIPIESDHLQTLTRAQAILSILSDSNKLGLSTEETAESLHTLISIIAPYLHRRALFPPLHQPSNQFNLTELYPNVFCNNGEPDTAVRFKPTVQLNSDDMELAEELKAASKSIRKAISDDKDEIKINCPGDQLKISRRPVLSQIIKEYPEPQLAAKAMYSGLCYEFEFGVERVSRCLSLCVVIAGRVMLWKFVQAAPDGRLSRLESSKDVPMDAILQLRKEDCREFKLADLEEITMFANLECFVIFSISGKGQILIESPDRLMLHKYVVMNYKLATSLTVYRPEMEKSPWTLLGERLNLTVAELPIVLPILGARKEAIGSLITIKLPSKLRGAECVVVSNAQGSHLATKSAIYRAAFLRVKEDSDDTDLTPDETPSELFCLLHTSGELAIFRSPSYVRASATFQLGHESSFTPFDRRPPGTRSNKVFGAFKDFLNRALSGSLIEPGLFGIKIIVNETKQLLFFFDDSDQRDEWTRSLTFTALSRPLTF